MKKVYVNPLPEQPLQCGVFQVKVDISQEK